MGFPKMPAPAEVLAPQDADLEFDALLDQDYSVILLDAEFPGGMFLRTTLQAMGVLVNIGSHDVEATSPPLILLNSPNRSRPEVKARINRARICFPQAPIAFVTGEFGCETDIALYDDARAILCAAGIAFVCPMISFG